MKTLTTILAATVIYFALNVSAFSQSNWVAFYNSGGNQMDLGYKTSIDNQGNMLITGVSMVNGNYMCSVVKYSPSGVLLWSRLLYGYNGTGFSIGRKVLIDQSDNIYICAEGSGINQSSIDFLLYKFDSNGNQIYCVRYGNPNYAEVFGDATFDAAGYIIVALGSITGNSNIMDAVVVRYDRAYGSVVHSRIYNPAQGFNHVPVKVLSAYSTIYIVGNRYAGVNTRDVFAASFTFSNLSFINDYTFNGNLNMDDNAISACITPSNKILITGSAYNNFNDQQILVIGLNDSLIGEWATMNSYSTGLENGTDIIGDGNNIYVCGTAGNDAMTLKFSQNGVLQWSRRYDRGEWATRIQTDNNGGIYVSGASSTSGTGRDAMILKYDNAGNLQFNYNYNGPAFNDDLFDDMFVAPNGQIYACGHSTNYVNNILNYDILITKLAGVMTGISGTGNEIPNGFKLEQNYPNPFNPSTKIGFSIPKSGAVKIAVFDITGKEVATLVDEVMNTGSYEVEFNAAKLSSGTYFYRIIADGFTDIKKMTLVK